MAESPEHSYLKQAVNGVLSDFSHLELYSYSEVDRRTFDFASLLKRDLTRPVVGQVLWANDDGIEKDLRTLAHDAESDIKVYVAKDTVRHRQAFSDIVASFRRTGRYPDLFKFKPIWIPHDFDADVERHQETIHQHLKSVVVNDILFNVVFGNLAARDVSFLLQISGAFALQLGMLRVIATEGYVNMTTLAERLSISSSPIREKLILLQGAGMLEQRRGAYRCEVTTKGQVFLDLCNRVFDAYTNRTLDPELAFILAKLDCEPVTWEEVDQNEDPFPESLFVNLVKTVRKHRDWLER